MRRWVPVLAPAYRDLYERVREQALKQNAIVMAWFAWQAATASGRLPRP